MKKEENEVKYLLNVKNKSYVVEINANKEGKNCKITKVDNTKNKLSTNESNLELKNVESSELQKIKEVRSLLLKNKNNLSENEKKDKAQDEKKKKSDSTLLPNKEFEDIIHYLKNLHKTKVIEKDNSKLATVLKSKDNFIDKKIEDLRKLLHANLKGQDCATPEAQDEACDFIIKHAKNLPKWTSDPQDKIEHLKSRRLKDTGKLLWAYGYDDLSLLGIGFCGVVYKDEKSNKAIKVTRKDSENNYYKKMTVGPDELSTKIINKILKTNKGKEYFMPIESLNGRFIYESPVAAGDFAELTKALNPLKDIKIDKKIKSNKEGSIIENKEVNLLDYEESKAKDNLKKAYSATFIPASHKAPLRVQGRTIYHPNDFYKGKASGEHRISDLIEDAVSVMKAIKILHDHGYTHNDIKPDNFLQVEKCASNLGSLELNSTNSSNNKSKTSFFKLNTATEEKRNLVLADFGTIQSIKGEMEDPRIFLGWPVRFIPGGKEANTGTKEKIIKREVWNAGVALFMMLFGENLMSFQSWSFEYAINKLNKWDLEKQFNGILWPKLKYIYVPEDEKRVKKFIETIRDMVYPTPKYRLNVEESIKRLQEIS